MKRKHQFSNFIVERIHTGHSYRISHTGYLMEHQNKNLSYNMYGEPLSPEIINISKNAKIKMKEYYEIIKTKGRVSIYR